MPPKGSIVTQSVGFTVADMATSVDFLTKLCPFEQISDREISGADVEQLTGLSNISLRVVRLKLGDELVELTQYSSSGKPMPTDTHSNDRWFQHLAIVVSDMDKAFAQLQKHGVRTVSDQPQTLPKSNPDMGGIQAIYFRDPDGHYLEFIQFPPDNAGMLLRSTVLIRFPNSRVGSPSREGASTIMALIRGSFK